jgi:hypothetical protein
MMVAISSQQHLPQQRGVTFLLVFSFAMFPGPGKGSGLFRMQPLVRSGHRHRRIVDLVNTI